MAIDFYELGKRSGAKTPKGQQSGFESLVSSAIKPIEDMLANSKATTAALTAAMPAGVPIEKVPEELRGQVTNFLTENKAAYKDATKVLASGINPSSERYTEAVEVINRVNSRFENLSSNLENIALERQKYLDDPNYSPNTSRSNATIMSDLANGSLYSSMTVNEDGSWNYKDTNGESKAFKDFRIDKQGYLGQQGHLAMVEHLNKNAYDINGNVKNWEGDLKDYYNLQVNQLFNTLGPKGSQDYVMADDEFLQARYDSKKLKGTKGNFEDYKDALTQGSKEDLIEDYKQYNLRLLEKQHGNAVAKNKSSKTAGGKGSGKSYIEAAKSYQTYEDQDKKVLAAQNKEVLYDWGGVRYDPNSDGTYTIEKDYRKETGNKYINISPRKLLSGEQFGLSNRISNDMFSSSNKLDKLSVKDEFNPLLVDLQKKGGYLNKEQEKNKIIDEYLKQNPED